MTTPNIEELINNLTIKAGVMEMGEKIAWGSDTALMRQAAATLQSQAERIKVLELDLDVQAGSIEAVQAVNTRQAERIEALEGQLDTQAKSYGLAVVERDQLRGQTDPCYTCDHFREGRLPNVRIHDETCYECREYYVSKWEAKSE